MVAYIIEKITIFVICTSLLLLVYLHLFPWWGFLLIFVYFWGWILYVEKIETQMEKDIEEYGAVSKNEH